MKPVLANRLSGDPRLVSSVRKHLIVMPAYNEEEALPQTVASLSVVPEGFEAVIINDGSTDQTGDVAERLVATAPIPLHVLHLPVNSGIGAAVQTGYRFALQQNCYTYVIQLDADGQHPAAALASLVEHCDQHQLDLCVGSRFLNPLKDDFQSTLPRRIGIRFFSRLIQLLVGTRITDPTSGLRCAGPRVWRRFADFYPEDYPEPESLFWCARNRLKIGEIPVSMMERQGGSSSIHHHRAVYYMLKVSMAIVFDRLRQREYIPS